MANSTKINSVKELRKEVELLRSFVIGQVGKDPEGEYKPEFVRKMLKAAQEPPVYEFKDADSFLKHIRGK
jgi:hypothetical protein